MRQGKSVLEFSVREYCLFPVLPTLKCVGSLKKAPAVVCISGSEVLLPLNSDNTRKAIFRIAGIYSPYLDSPGFVFLPMVSKSNWMN